MHKRGTNFVSFLMGNIMCCFSPNSWYSQSARIFCREELTFNSTPATKLNSCSVLVWGTLDIFFCIEIWPGALLDKPLQNVQRSLLFWGCAFLGLHPSGVANGHPWSFTSLDSWVGVSRCCVLRRIGHKSVLIFHFLLTDGTAVGKQLVSQAPGAPQDRKLHK